MDTAPTSPKSEADSRKAGLLGLGGGAMHNSSKGLKGLCPRFNDATRSPPSEAASGQRAAPSVPLIRPHPVCVGSFINTVRTAPSFTTGVPNGIPGSGMCSNQTAAAIHPGPYIKPGEAGNHTAQPRHLPEGPAQQPSREAGAQHGESSHSIPSRNPRGFRPGLPLGASPATS